MRRRSHRRGSSFRVPRSQRRNGSARGELARFSSPGCGAGREPCPPPAALPACAHPPRGAAAAGGIAGLIYPRGKSSPPLLRGSAPLPARPHTLSFHPRLPLLSLPRVAGGSYAHSRGSSLRGAGRRAAGDRQKAPTSQILLNPSSGDNSGQPERV